jgi:hypothetical protein
VLEMPHPPSGGPGPWACHGTIWFFPPSLSPSRDTLHHHPGSAYKDRKRYKLEVATEAFHLRFITFVEPLARGGMGSKFKMVRLTLLHPLPSHSMSHAIFQGLACKYSTVAPGLLPGPGLVPKGGRNGPITSACMLWVSHPRQTDVVVTAADDAAGTGPGMRAVSVVAVAAAAGCC